MHAPKKYNPNAVANTDVVPIFHAIQGLDLGVLRDALTRERAYIELHFNRPNQVQYRQHNFDRIARINVLLERIEAGR